MADISAIAFDIETAPLPEEDVKAMLPPFDPDSVKLGNTKDPAKIKAKIEEAEASYLSSVMEKAALDPRYSYVIAIGLYSDGGHFAAAYPHEGWPEADLLPWFWNQVNDFLAAGVKLVGANCNNFDLPYLRARSWLHNVEVPAGLSQGRYFHRDVIDVIDHWSQGARPGMFAASGGLNGLARFFGLGEKTGSGKDFAQLRAEDPDAAEEYLRTDVRLTMEIAERMGLV